MKQACSFGAPPAQGKTHLLRAAIASAQEQRIAARWVAHPGGLVATAGRCRRYAGSDRSRRHRGCRRGGGDLQACTTRRSSVAGGLIAASRTPLAAMPLREDLRTRLGWGLVYEVLPLSDEDKPAAMGGIRRSARLSIVRRRDRLPACIMAGATCRRCWATLAALDRASLASKRPITVPLLKAWLRRAGRMSGNAGRGQRLSLFDLDNTLLGGDSRRLGAIPDRAGRRRRRSLRTSQCRVLRRLQGGPARHLRVSCACALLRHICPPMHYGARTIGCNADGRRVVGDRQGAADDGSGIGMAGSIHLHQRFDDSPAALQGQSASIRMNRKLAFLDGGMPIANAAKIADLRPQSVGRQF